MKIDGMTLRDNLALTWLSWRGVAAIITGNHEALENVFRAAEAIRAGYPERRTTRRGAR